ncbi:sulfatase-like hydrolase/transferase [Opitutales bacterium]|jgi:choline-sulfatase|nr:sulfatase-like hydrolase/transferase [Opitutales bacterium]
MKPTNVLFFMSDQHARHITGCYGNELIRTPNIDKIAEKGARYDAAYTPCPICVPARACFATGQYTHNNKYWDNAHPYDGKVTGWGHELIARGHRVESIGKLHYQDEKNADGFSTHHIPLNVVDGTGDPQSSIREDIPVRSGNHEAIAAAGPGDSSYLDYDQQIADTACDWLKEAATKDDKPWVLFVSFVCPHPPYTARPEHFDYYQNKDMPYPYQGLHEEWPDKPALNELRRVLEIDTPFSVEETKRISSAYYGTVNSMDDRIGEVLKALEQHGFDDNTRIVYTSDHGESLGQRGLYGKFTMHEDAAAVPLVMSGPDISQGSVVNTPVTLVDFHSTLLEMVTGEEVSKENSGDGLSLMKIQNGESADRSVISEYHAVASNYAWYLVRKENYKLIYYLDAPNELYDVVNDPLESNDLSGLPEHADLLQSMEAELRTFLDPEACDQEAKASQAAIIDRFGGRDAVMNRGTFINSPAPGEDADFLQEEK